MGRCLQSLDSPQHTSSMLLVRWMDHQNRSPVQAPLVHVLTASTGLAREIPRQTIREVIAGKVAGLIASRVLQVGDELPSERALASAMSVSRETIRGAIQSLAARGILEVAHGSRTRVVKSDVEGLGLGRPVRLDVSDYTVHDVHAARSLVERQVVAEAAHLISDDLLAALGRSLAAQEASLDDPVQFLICDREFHAAIYRSCGNLLLADIALDLYSYLLDSRRRIVSRPGRIAASIADHRAIFEALSAHDPEAAVIAFAQHEMRIYQSTAALLTETESNERITASTDKDSELGT